MKYPIHESWLPFLQGALDSETMEYIVTHIFSDQNLCPHKDNVFKVLEMPLDKIRVVVIGQDPYPNKEHATGLAFAVPEGTIPPYSLSVIIDELAINYYNDIRIEGGPFGDFQEDLNHWVEQGVFLLNKSLTTLKGKPGAHKNVWKGLTDLIIKTIAENTTNVVWMLWGKDACEAEELIKSHKADRVHEVLTSGHPAAERYTNKSFIGNKHFNEVNRILLSWSKPVILWLSTDELPF
jgi:uracil-DNA glycosylase